MGFVLEMLLGAGELLPQSIAQPCSHTDTEGVDGILAFVVFILRMMAVQFTRYEVALSCKADAFRKIPRR